ncbi:restriction endonuclease [Brevibacillus fluminis]|uniref:nSTAND3 domain-containing NTPase n=1 Tax=Brevibacillus fluminis TaxID=511487 RepID=UPI003F8B2D1A
MSNYDFHMLLEPLEFEKLVCDIIHQRDGFFLKMYKEGRDLGIDGSFTDISNKVIVQVKRYKPDFNKLYRDLEHLELPKVRKLKPARYILGVSMDFSPDDENKIMELFKGYIVNPKDIISKMDMNRLLEEPAYKQTLLKYPKLWYPNLNVLEKVLTESVYRAIYKESAEELKEACKTVKTYVPTQIYHDALQKWSENNVIILSGEPGVGKTTMAYILALAFLQPNNLNGFVWANSIEDVYALLENGQKQVIILDDFWGSIFWREHTRRNDETRLNKLIRRIIEFSGEKRLILTTREYILQQGFQKHPLLKKTLEQYSLICTMEEYADHEKASILFSHLYASRLEYEYVNYLYLKTDSIVHHENYNPRVLALFLSNNKPNEGCLPEEYYEEMCDFFDNPGEFWMDIFLELSTEAQIVAMLLLISSTPMHLESMGRCYRKYIQNCTVQMTVKNLSDCFAELEKTMIKSVYIEEYDDVLLKFSMPAVQDFLFAHLKRNCEQFVPQLLECCAYYNQLQFILDYLSVHCSNKLNDLIVQKCIKHYHNYESCVMYDESWDWDIDFFKEEGHLDRFFNLLRYYERERHRTLYLFLESEIKDYCVTMGRGDLRAQYKDLHNLPNIIVRCIKNGMAFTGRDIIKHYCEEAFSVHHYIAMQQFQEVFPEEYTLFHRSYYKKIKSILKSTLLAELKFLNDYDMVVEFDMLIDNIPDILEKFGLLYSKEFGRKLLSVCGREPLSIQKKDVIPYKPSDYKNDPSIQTLKTVKEDAAKWLLGPTETYLDDEQIAEYFSRSNLYPALKEEFKQVLDTTNPRYVYDFFQTKEAIELLLAAVHNGGAYIKEGESNFLMSILMHIVQRDQVLMQQLMIFCADSFTMFMYQDVPVLRINHFLTSDAYTTYLKNNSQLSEIVFQHLIIKDDQWVRFLHIPLYIYCYAIIICYSEDDTGLVAFYSYLWGNDLNKTEHDTWYDSYIDYEWGGCIYRLFEELKPDHFNKNYVEPTLKRYLDKLGGGDDTSRVFNHLFLSRLQFEYKESGDFSCFINTISEELSMIEQLAIAEIWDSDFPPKLTIRKLKDLQKREIVRKEGDKWIVLVYKIMDVELLKEFGVYEASIKFLNEVESTYSRFINGNYSQIKRSF